MRFKTILNKIIMSRIKVQKKVTNWYDIENILKKSSFILWLAFANVINNTQKVSYSYIHSSFDNFDQMNVVAQGFSWLMVLLGVVSIELAILVFVSRGSKGLGMFFAFLIFLLNFNYLVPENIFDIAIGAKEFRDLIKCFIIALLSPIIVYFFSEMYVEENKKDYLFQVKKEQVTRVIKSLRLIINELRVTLSKSENSNSNLSVSQNELIVSLEKQLIEKSNSLSKYETDYSNLVVSNDKLKEEYSKVEKKLFTYVSKFTCKKCNTEFDTQFQLRGHESSKNCVTL